MKRIICILKTETFLIISFIAALITSFYVKPSMDYLEYIDYKVLAILFCLMIIVAGLKDIGLFNVLAQKMTTGSTNTRGLFLSLIMICFFSSMLVTNDVALITFVPFSILVLTITEQNDRMIFVIVMQTVAANLGSMLTPIGNPQNLYLFSYYEVSSTDFFRITVPISLIGFILIFGISVFGKHEQINVKFKLKEKIANKNRLYMFIFLFILSVFAVFRIIDYKTIFTGVFTTVLFVDKNLFKKVDYSLLVTFIFFFIFTGNIVNIEPVQNYLSNLIMNHELIYSVALSQVISNVPAAVLLSSFTENYKSLIIGTNIGGLGTLIASLASLISYKFYIKTENSKPLKYLITFSLINILMLLILLPSSLFM